MTKNIDQKKENEEKDRVLLRINSSFGPFIENCKIDDLLSPSTNQAIKHTVTQLEYFFERPITTINQDILKRYTEITTQETHVTITPSYQNIIERIIDPLISAKRQYCLGEYLSCIALSGIISEMLTLLIWKMSNFNIRGQKITEEDEKKLFGQSFEDIRQIRRENILLAIKTIGGKIYEQFEVIRNIRNKYLHSWEYDTRQQKGDANKTILAAFKLYKAIADMTLVIKEGNQTISISPALLDYLKSSNLDKN
ncbi:hypothetical protein C4569_00335 [Candidatus Parcubacteria bacterium]|nr:MAG: hypothetical protein C4569_00335 [Candidatus Parcubacteria bacterium]